MIHLLFHSQYNQLVLFFPASGLKQNQGIIFCVHQDYTCNSHRFWSTTNFKQPLQSSCVILVWAAEGHSSGSRRAIFACPAQVTATASQRISYRIYPAQANKSAFVTQLLSLEAVFACKGGF